MYKRFASFLTAYLNQDWDLDYSSDTDAAVAFATENSLEYVKLTLGEAAILASIANDAQLDSIVASFKLDYFSPNETNREWLGRLPQQWPPRQRSAPSRRRTVSSVTSHRELRCAPDALFQTRCLLAVSYTHLTLPTILLV